MSSPQRGQVASTPFRSGLASTALQALPLGAVAPSGWLLAQLRLQAEGLTGHLEEIWPDVGPRSGWLGGDGEDWERGPYYCDGLMPLAYLLEDERLIAKARRWVEWTLASQQQNGQFGPTTNADWWPRMIMLKALTQYYEATGDARVLPFMARYCRYQYEELPGRPLRDWGRVRGADNVLSVLWLYERTGDPSLPALADLLLAQTFDWGTYLAELPVRTRMDSFSHLTHVVNVAMGLKTPAMRYRRDGQARHLEAIQTGLENLLRYHGQVEGIFSGDEWLAGLDPAQGVELCAVVEMMFSLEQLIETFGIPAFADRLELLAYNALAATITADLRAHQYDQQPNQVLCTVAPRNWTSNTDDSNIFGLEPHFGCCTANMHQGWPKFARSLWMSTSDGGLAAVAYAPCSVTTGLPDGAEVRIEERTNYPFDGTIELVMHTGDTAATFPLHVRIPGWCRGAQLRVNGAEQELPDAAAGFVVLRRAWRQGDTVHLLLPMPARSIARPAGAIGIAMGPLLFALQIGEEWTRIPNSPGFGDWEVRPTTPWNYALVAAPEQAPEQYEAEHAPAGRLPFGGKEPPIRIHTQGRRVPGWELVQSSAGPLPRDLAAVEREEEPITLAPYGCARLRIAEFPLLEGVTGNPHGRNSNGAP